MGPENGDSPRKTAEMAKLIEKIHYVEKKILDHLSKTTIFTAKVYTEMKAGADSRVFGWWTTFDRAKEGLDNFGDECKWSYAVIEEFYEGMHPMTASAIWFKYGDNGWEPHSENSNMTRCINHAIG